MSPGSSRESAGITDEGCERSRAPWEQGQAGLLLPPSPRGRVVHSAPSPGLEGDEEGASGDGLLVLFSTSY